MSHNKPNKKPKVKQPPCPFPDNILYGEEFTVEPQSGMYVPDEIKAILAKPGFIKNNEGGLRLRNLYINHSVGFYHRRDLSPFGVLCFLGMLNEVIMAVETNTAPPLNGTETPYEAGYATITVWGSQRVTTVDDKRKTQHLEVLQYLISKGVPVNQRDISWFTPVHHYCINSKYERRVTPMLELLLKNGADPNAQDKAGTTAIITAFDHNYVEAIELLMEYGADMDLEDADGCSPMKCYVQYGPIVAATVLKCLRKRAGEVMPRDEKKCDNCHANDKHLKNCARCHVGRYCSVVCQKAHWPTHKTTCRAFVKAESVTVKPFYYPGMRLTPMADTVRTMLGVPAENTTRGTVIPKVTEPKSVVIKIQVPHPLVQDMNTNMLVYTKKRDELGCLIRKCDDSQAYDRIHEVIRAKGVGGLKAYFSATIYDKNKLEIKVSEVLAPQPF